MKTIRWIILLIVSADIILPISFILENDFLTYCGLCMGLIGVVMIPLLLPGIPSIDYGVKEQKEGKKLILEDNDNGQQN